MCSTYIRKIYTKFTNYTASMGASLPLQALSPGALLLDPAGGTLHSPQTSLYACDPVLAMLALGPLGHRL